MRAIERSSSPKIRAQVPSTRTTQRFRNKNNYSKPAHSNSLIKHHSPKRISMATKNYALTRNTMLPKSGTAKNKSGSKGGYLKIDLSNFYGDEKL